MRTPSVLQLEAIECGAAALGMILGYHGRHVPLATLRRECGVSRDGSKASSLVKAARRYGLAARGWSKNLDDALRLPPPFIVFWNFNHFVVVEGVRGESVHLNDPALGHRTVDLAEFDRGFTGVVLTFERGPDFRPEGAPPSVWRGLRARFEGAGGGVAYAVLAGLLLVAPGLALPAFSQVFVDSVVIEGHAGWLRPVLLAMAVAALLQAVLRALQLRYLRRLRTCLALRLGNRFLWHLLRLPASFYAQRYAGEIAGRVATNDRLAQLLSGRLAQTVIDAAVALGYGALMFWYDLVLATIASSAVLVNFAVLRALAARRIEANMRLLHDYGRAESVAVAGLQGIETVKAGGEEDALFSAWAGHAARGANARQDLELGTQALAALPGLVTALMTALVLVVGGLRVVDGQITVGMLVAFQLLALSFLAPVANLTALGGTLQELRGELARLDDVLEQSTLPVPPAVVPAEEEASGRLTGRVELRDVSFGYNPLEPPLLTGFNLAVPAGARVALVGPTGSGKTTVLRLLTGELTPGSGAVLYDGVPREGIPREVLARSFAAVSQEVQLFAGTVRENLSLWDDRLPDEALLRACRDAGIHAAVGARPGGLDTPVLEDAVNFSGGERQRLDLARALARDPAVLVLDEATSALDAETEREVLERLRARGSTYLLVSHRLSAVRDCDEIVVLDQGRIVERGSHAALLEHRGLYARLVASGEPEAAA